MPTTLTSRLVNATSKLGIGFFFLLTSLYFLLAYIPYTNIFFIHAPPYPWLTWFARHHAWLYGAVCVLTLFAFRQHRSSTWFRTGFWLQIAVGLWLASGSTILRIGNTWPAFVWSIVVLTPYTLMLIVDLREAALVASDEIHSWSYGNAILAGVIVAATAGGGTYLLARANDPTHVHFMANAALLLWMTCAHLLVAIGVFSAFNAVGLLAGRFCRRPGAGSIWLCVVAGSGALAAVFRRFLVNSLTLDGWRSYVYAAVLAVAVVCLTFSALLPGIQPKSASTTGERGRATATAVCIAALFVLAGLYVPTAIGDADWNGVIHYGFYSMLWIAVVYAVLAANSSLKRYSAASVIALVIVAGATYAGLEYSTFLWARTLGSTPDEIESAAKAYSSRNASFGMVFQLLHWRPQERCQGLCAVMEQCTNLRDTQARNDVTLVSPLTRSSVTGPNIFIIVMDSLRRDYLGAYNPKVDFSPNLDAFARDSVVMENAYTRYAGTALSEPSIWSGSMLLHAQYPQPFGRFNSLLKLARTDDYQVIVSDDPILREVLKNTNDIVRFDSDKPWNGIELSSAAGELNAWIDSHKPLSRPILFYSQPMNVHQGTANKVPEMKSEHWRPRPGFQTVTAFRVHDMDRFFGEFIGSLKSRGLYDNSIVILTADHGDGYGETEMCQGHDQVLCPVVMQIPLIIHLPKAIKTGVVYDRHRIATLTDVTPSLYYLLGHRPLVVHPLYGHPLFAATKEELDRYQQDEYLIACAGKAAYGLLMENGRYLYINYGSSPQRFLFDLIADPPGIRNILTPALEDEYDHRIMDDLVRIGNFYGYPTTGGRENLQTIP